MPTDVLIVESQETLVIVEPVEHVVVVGASQGPSGPPGPAGPGGSEVLVRAASGAIGGHRVVALTSDDTVVYASSADNTGYRVVGVSTGAAVDGADVTVQQVGLVAWPSSAFTTGLPVYLTTDGLVSHTPPATGIVRQVGIALAANKLQVAIGPAFVRG